jgi:hypothetical protein
VVDSNNAHGLGSEQMSDMEARCADSAFPAAREVKPARGPMRETNADALFVCTILAYDKFSVSQPPPACLTAADAELPKVAYETASTNGRPVELLKHRKYYESSERVSNDELL